MNSVHRVTRIRRFLRRFILGESVRNYVTAGDINCRQILLASLARKRQIQEDNIILACARYDLNWEIRCGFWDLRAI